MQMYNSEQFVVDWRSRAFVDKLRRVKPLIDDKKPRRALPSVVGYYQRQYRMRIDIQNAHLLEAICEASPSVETTSMYDGVVRTMRANRQRVKELKYLDLNEQNFYIKMRVYKARSVYNMQQSRGVIARKPHIYFADTHYQRYIYTCHSQANVKKIDEPSRMPANMVDTAAQTVDVDNYNSVADLYIEYQ